MKRVLITSCFTQALRLTVLLLSCGYALPGLAAKDVELSSSTQKTHLIELYTSQGCSSCPPADNWLNKLVEKEGLWTDFIPMAFHVDYWDYLGWQDPFAKQGFSERQREFRRQGLVSSVYTPGMVKNGKEWRNWFLPSSM